MVDRVGRVEADDASRLKPLVLDDLVQHGLGVGEKLLGLLSHGLVVEDLRVGAVRVLTPDLPALEEGVPVDEGDQLRQVVLLEDSRP